MKKYVKYIKGQKTVYAFEVVDTLGFLNDIDLYNMTEEQEDKVFYSLGRIMRFLTPALNGKIDTDVYNQREFQIGNKLYSDVEILTKSARELKAKFESFIVSKKGIEMIRRMGTDVKGFSKYKSTNERMLNEAREDVAKYLRFNRNALMAFLNDGNNFNNIPEFLQVPVTIVTQEEAFKSGVITKLEDLALDVFLDPQALETIRNVLRERIEARFNYEIYNNLDNNAKCKEINSKKDKTMDEAFRKLSYFESEAEYRYKLSCL